jgi:ribose transport system permease protein
MPVDETGAAGGTSDLAGSEAIAIEGTAPVSHEARGRGRAVVASLLSDRFALVLAWIGVIVLFSVLRPDTFASTANLKTILSSQSVLVIISLAVVVPLTVGEFDLSVAATLGLAAITASILNVNDHVGIWPSVLVGLLVGPLVGLLNAFFVVVVGVDGLIATLGIGTLVTGIAYAFSNYVIVTGIDNALVTAVSNNLFGLPYSFYYGVALAVIMWLTFRYTPIGQHLLFVGRARDVARLSGLRVQRIRIGAFVAGGTLSAVAGLVLAGTVGGADPSASTSFLLPAYAAAFLGATAISPGRFNPWGTLIAVYFLVTGITGLQLMGLSDWVQQVFYGIALVLAVTVSRLAERRRRT